MMKTKKVLMASAVVLIVVVAAIGVWRWRHGGTPRTLYETQVISRGDMENSVTATGTVEPMEQVEVGTQVSGIIDKINVDYNSIVKKGEVIAELDKTVLLTELETARLSVESNKNEFLYQERNYKRNQQLYKKKLLSDSEFETAEYTYKKAEIAYRQSLAQEEKARTNLGYATIYSPIDGVVISRAVEVGQTVASSFSTPTLFTIANDLRRVQVVANVDEADIGHVAEGAEVTFTVDAYPDLVFEGKVNQVRMEAVTNNNVVTYEVVIHAENPDLKLKPGLTANISIYSMRRVGVLRLPVKATRFRPVEDGFSEQMQRPERPQRSERPAKNDTARRLNRPDGRPFKDSLHRNGNIRVVFVMPAADNASETRPEMRKVRVGATDQIYYEVLDGLAEGETVCVGMETVASGKKKPAMQQSPFMPGPPGNRNRSGSGAKKN